MTATNTTGNKNMTQVDKQADQNQDQVEKEDQNSKTTLFVRNVPLTATKEDLESFFSEIGPIRSCFVVTSPSSTTTTATSNSENQHRGIGYVQFAIAEDAQRAIEQLKTEKFQGTKKLKFGFALKKSLIKQKKEDQKASSALESFKDDNSKNNNHQSSSASASASSKLTSNPITKNFVMKKGKLIVRNLSFRCSESDLKRSFVPYGSIIQVSIPLKQDGKKRGFAFVEFEKTEDAQKAIEALNGTEIIGRQVAIDWSIPKDSYESIVAAENEVIQMQNDGIHEEKDEISENKSIENDDGHEEDNSEQEEEKEEDDDVEMEDVTPEESPKIVKEIQKQQKGNKPSAEKQPNSTSSSLSVSVEEGTTIFIRNVSFDTTEDSLSECFSTFGKLRYTRITKDRETGISKGTGFVSFLKKEDADKCLEEFKSAQEDPILQFEQQKQQVHSSKKDDSKPKGKSLLQPEPSLTASHTAFVLDGRFLQVSLAVNKKNADKLKEESVVRRKELDKRNLYLMKEGVVFPDSYEAQGMKPSELSKRQQSYSNRKQLLAKNHNLFISKTRLSVRNLPSKIDEPQLRQAAIKAIRTFWTQVKEGSRPTLDADVLEEDMKTNKVEPSATRRVLFKQVKIMRDKDRIDANTNKPKSKGFGFIEFPSHADAIACLRILNNNPFAFDESKESPLRPIVEFAVENQLILKKREERRQAMMKGSTSHAGGNSEKQKGKSSSSVTDKNNEKQKNKKKRSADEATSNTENNGESKDKQTKLKSNKKPKLDKQQDQSQVESKKTQKKKETNNKKKKKPSEKPTMDSKSQANIENFNQQKQQKKANTKKVEDQESKKSKKRKNNNEKTDDFDQLIKQRKSMLFSNMDTKNGNANMNRWFE